MEHEENSSAFSGAGDLSGDGAGETPANSRRTYDCSFCKRGFTNAQALGGHMNIHRKERSKSKRYVSSSSSSSSSSSTYFSPATEFANPNLTAPAMSSQPSLFPIVESFQGGLNNYTYDRRGGFLHHARGDYNPNPNPMGQFGRFYGENEELHLSLGIPFIDEETRRRSSPDGAANGSADDLDLELRLGHNNR